MPTRHHPPARPFDPENRYPAYDGHRRRIGLEHLHFDADGATSTSSFEHAEGTSYYRPRTRHYPPADPAQPESSATNKIFDTPAPGPHERQQVEEHVDPQLVDEPMRDVDPPSPAAQPLSPPPPSLSTTPERGSGPSLALHSPNASQPLAPSSSTSASLSPAPHAPLPVAPLPTGATTANAPPTLMDAAFPGIPVLPDAAPHLRSLLGVAPTDTAALGLHTLADPPPGAKPNYPLPTLIKLAIHGSAHQRLTLQEIYGAIEDRFEWYRARASEPSWKASPRSPPPSLQSAAVCRR